MIPPPAGSAVLKMFALLFSSRWVGRWTPDPAAQKKGEPPRLRGFYQRIYSLRVTLWYLIYQRLNFDPTLAAVVTDLRQGGADRLGRRGRKLSTRVRPDENQRHQPGAATPAPRVAGGGPGAPRGSAV